MHLQPAPSATVPHLQSYSSFGVQQILWQTSPLQLHSQSLPPSGSQRWKLDAARAFLVVIPGTAVATTAPPISRNARERDIGLAIDRARSVEKLTHVSNLASMVGSLQGSPVLSSPSEHR